MCSNMHFWDVERIRWSITGSFPVHNVLKKVNNHCLLPTPSQNAILTQGSYEKKMSSYVILFAPNLQIKLQMLLVRLLHTLILH